ncbi:MAG: NAD(P)/FAD-dependent oxidoreductase [Balneolaceae bacterium]
MNLTNNNIPVIIVGGGPVGLFLAICLLKKGINCKVIEKRHDPVPDSRSLGIHPVSLALFDSLGIIKPFLEKGVKMRKGIALTERKKIGEISFESCPKPHNYILACPQFYTEQFLREELSKLDTAALITKAEFKGFEDNEHSVTTKCRVQESEKQFSSKFLIGCDGKNSLVRQQASIHFSGKRYPDTYIMGDFKDTTDFGPDAAVFLLKGGMIECFPLPNGMRRWVVKTTEYISKPTPTDLTKLVKARINYDLSEVKSTMFSSFGVQHFTAETFVKNRILLAGDAAHVVSPIGGQGMNLGWLGAWDLADALSRIFHNENASQFEPAPSILKSYSLNHKKTVRKAARRAELNMWLGRKSSLPFFRNLLVRGMLNTVFRKKTAELFTMQGLKAGDFNLEKRSHK